MHDHKKPMPDAATRAAALSGVVIAMAAVLGAQMAMFAPHRAHRSAEVAQRSLVTSANPIYDTSGIFVVAGASVIVLTWLHRQSSRAVLAICPPSILRSAHPTPVLPFQPRKASISQHVGGLYGP